MHRSIVAPLAATLTASLALGVGVAMARSERERRATRSQRSRERQFGLLPRESLADGLRRMALGQLDSTIEVLAGEGDGVRAEQAVHEARKALKRLRALMRLLQDELGAQAFERENSALRDAGRRLAGARDAEVMVATLDALAERHPKRLARRGGVAELRAGLLAERDRAAELDGAAARGQVLAELLAIRARVHAWHLSQRDGIQTAAPSLERVYRKGRRRQARVAAGKGDQALAMHEWRKRVKDLRYAAEMLDRCDPDRSPGALAKRVRRSHKRARERGRAAYLQRLARRSDELAEVLGEDHDLVVLAARVRSEGGRRGRASRRARKALLRMIAQRRRRLRARALRAGRRLYRRRPKKFMRRVRGEHAGAALS